MENYSKDHHIMLLLPITSISKRFKMPLLMLPALLILILLSMREDLEKRSPKMVGMHVIFSKKKGMNADLLG